jgi:hypothetical protein
VAEGPARGGLAGLPGRRFVAQLVDGQAEIRLEPEAFSDHEATVSFRMLGR